MSLNLSTLQNLKETNGKQQKNSFYILYSITSTKRFNGMHGSFQSPGKTYSI